MSERFALPEFQGRISPVFDAALRVLLFELDREEIHRLGAAELGAVSPGCRPAWLGERGVELLICGGISRPLALAVRHRGIRLIPWVAGEVEAVLEAYRQGRLLEPVFRGPGCGRPEGGRRRRRGRGWREEETRGPRRRGGWSCREEIEQDREGWDR